MAGSKRGIPTQCIGWREWVGLPMLGIEEIKAKIDTGAATSALHVVHASTIWRDGRAYVAFEVHPWQRNSEVSVTCEAPVRDHRWITSSTGHREHRPVIRTTWAINGHHYPIDLSLTNRGNMGFRMLIGRRALRHRLLVDPARSFVNTTAARARSVPGKPGA